MSIQSEGHRPTQFGILYCEGEGALRQACDREPAFGNDILLVKEAVAAGKISPRHALAWLEEGGEMNMGVNAELTHCLGAISAGTCTQYRFTTSVRSQKNL